MFKFGLDPSADQPEENYKYFIWAGFALIWFTQHDLMDGARARRQKAGSPFGRLFDEANDMIQMACYSTVMAYVFRIDNALLSLVFVFLNILCFAMEMKYLLCNELILTLGDIGSVEVETFMAAIFILSGVYGPQVLENNVPCTFGYLSWKQLIVYTLFTM